MPSDWNLIVEISGKNTELLVTPRADSFGVSMNGRCITVSDDIHISSPVLETVIEHQKYVTQLIKHDSTGNLRIRFKGTAFNVKVMTEVAAEFARLMPEKPEMDVSKVVSAPMPGLVKSVSCEVGEMVAEGQEVCVIEAMKMQNSLSIATTGKVKAVHCKPGDAVEEEQVLIELE